MSSEASAIDAKPKRRSMRAALRSILLVFGLGFLCAGLLSLAVAPAFALSRAIAMSLAQTPVARGTVGAVVMGLCQAVICFAVFSLLPMVLELDGAVVVCASILAAAVPSLVLIFAQGFSSLMPLPVLLGRIAGLALSGLAGYASLRWRPRRAQKS